MAEASPNMVTTLARNWWAPAVRGAIAIIFGVVVWFWPGLALQTVILIFAIYAMCSGVLSIADAVLSISEREPWFMLALEGMLSLGAGTIALLWPDLAAKTLLVLIAIWAILGGVLNLISAVRMRNDISDEWILVLTGAVGIIFGIVAIARPQSGALALLWLIGAFGIITGVLLIAQAWRLRKISLQISGSDSAEPGPGSPARLGSLSSATLITQQADDGADSGFSDPAKSSAPSNAQPKPVDGLDLADDQILDLDAPATDEQLEPADEVTDGSNEALHEALGITVEVSDDRNESKDDEGAANRETDPAPTTNESTVTGDENEPEETGITVVDAAGDLTSMVDAQPTADLVESETSPAEVEIAPGERQTSAESENVPVDSAIESLIASLPPVGSGWVRGNGEYDCPDDYPVKGNATSMIYHVPGGGSYSATMPTICFSTTDIAETAGFRAAKNQSS